MRALIRDKSDNTLMLIEVTEACYSPEDKELYLTSPDHDYCIEGIVQVNAHSAFTDLFDTGKVDLSIYKAILTE